VSKAKQKDAVKFLLTHAFTTPTKLLNPTIVNRFKYLGVADDVMGQQKALLESLMSERRIRLLMDGELLAPDNSYTTLEMIGDLNDGIWSELKADAPKVDVCRRALQRTYLDILKKALAAAKEEAAATPTFPRQRPMGDDEGPPNRNTDLRAVARAALTDLQGRLEAAISRTRDSITAAHLMDCRREVETLLRGKL
jgi:hypothetical protein